jgi:VWFA-related protein
MHTRLISGLHGCLLLGLFAAGQEAPDTTIRITVNLVQVDAVVTDSNGRAVTSLEAKDFEILQDGKPQKITHFAYIPTLPAQPAAVSAAVAENKVTPPVPMPPAVLRPSQVRRTIVLMVDDLGLSFESMDRVRRALKNFVDQQMQPGDLVAILRTGAGVGALQQFSSDKRQLYAAINRVKYNAVARQGIRDLTADPEVRAEARLNEFRENVLSMGTLGAIQFVVNGLRELPGRKSVILFSDSMRLFTREQGPMNMVGTNQTVIGSLQRLTDLCNRSSVVMYTIDPRGVASLGFTAADQSGRVTGDQASTAVPARAETVDQLDGDGFASEVSAALSKRGQDFLNTQEGLNYLAHDTGGLFVHNTNDISAALNQVLDDQSGYYLIGYTPDASTFDEKANRPLFHKISVRVKHRGLRVRTRTGFYGVPDRAAHPALRTRGEQLMAALTSPFNGSGIHLRLTPLFANSATKGSFIDSLVYVDAHDLTFAGQPDDWHTAVLDVAVMTFDDNGAEVDRSESTFNIRVHGEEFKQAIKNGLMFSLNHPIKKAGAYQLHCAARDAASERVGSASQFIEVPDLGKGQLALSGLLVSGPAPDGPEANAGRQAGTDPLESPAVRDFKPGHRLAWALSIMNAQIDPATHLPDLGLQLRMTHDGKEVYSGKTLPVNVQKQADLKRIFAGGQMQLGTKMEPGEYVLQAVVTDNVAKKKYQTATQSMDFEVTP